MDAWVGERIVERRELIAAQATPATAGPDARLLELNTQINDVNDMFEDVMAAYRGKHISATTAFGNVAELEESLVPVVAERDALLAETALSAPEVLDGEAWEALDVDRRRAAAECALQAVYVNKTTTHLGNRFDVSRLDPVWR